MLYRIFRPIARFIVWVLNGHLHVHHKERLPEGTYILVAPHRNWWEPILFALAASPTEFMFMTKQELFKNPVLRWILNNAHAFPVNREHPGPSVIKTPVKGLKSEGLSLIMFHPAPGTQPPLSPAPWLSPECPAGPCFRLSTRARLLLKGSCKEKAWKSTLATRSSLTARPN